MDVRTNDSPVPAADGLRRRGGKAGRGGPAGLLPRYDRLFHGGRGDLSGGDRIKAARDLGAAHGCTLVLKGHRTVTVGPEGNALVNTTGNSGLAKGGSGDVLTGVIASLLAQGATPIRAAAAGVWLHGRTGDLAAEELTACGMTREDVAARLRGAFLEVTCGK